MTALHHLHEAGILYNLGQRADLKNQKPYTFMVRKGYPCVGSNSEMVVNDPLQAARAGRVVTYVCAAGSLGFCAHELWEWMVHHRTTVPFPPVVFADRTPGVRTRGCQIAPVRCSYSSRM